MKPQKKINFFMFSYFPPLSSAAKGIFVGAPCEFTCDKRLHHMFCNPISSKCECEKNYPVVIGK